MNTQLVASVVLASLALSIFGCASSDDGGNDSTAGTAGTAAGAAGASAGTGGTAGGTGGTAGAAGATAGAAGAAVFCDAPNTIFMLDGTMGGCNGSSCHIPANVQAFPPDLTSPGVETRLIDVVSESLICPGEKYIDTANIDNSLILKKLAATPSCGASMPFATDLLTQDKIDCIRNWARSVSGL